jgi:hypothetical protein
VHHGGVGGPAGAIALDRFQYGLNDTVAIEVIDTNAPGPLSAQVTSTTEPWVQNVILTGSNGVFHGSIPIAPSLAQMGDGVLAVSAGDLVTVSYTGASPAGQVVTTARVSVQAPTITNVHASALGGTQAVVSWTTNLGASSRVRFGTSGPLTTIADSSGYSTQHAVLLTSLHAGTTYRYDVESATPGGYVSADSLGGQHRSFTTRPAGSIALLMDDPSASVLATWSNAFAALGWNVDVLAAAANDPPLVGNSAAGLRSYDAVLWQVDPNKYPPFSDAQRAAIDSLLNFGGRLLVTGHDIGWGLSDAGSPSYTPEREAWIESGLKTRYFFDNLNADTLSGVAGARSRAPSPVRSPMPSRFTPIRATTWDLPRPPTASGAGTGPTISSSRSTWACTGRATLPEAPAESACGAGRHRAWSGCSTSGARWRAVRPRTSSRAPVSCSRRCPGCWDTARPKSTSSRRRRAPSSLTTNCPSGIRSVPTPAAHHRPLGGVLTGRRRIVGSGCHDRVRRLELRLDLTGALGGAPTPNSTTVMLRVRVADDGSPGLSGNAVMTGPFTLARAGGDSRGPVLAAGGATCSPLPIRRLQPASLTATFTDAEMGGSPVAAAEYSRGKFPAPAGSGTPMSGTFGSATVQASAALTTDDVVTGSVTFWLRGRDGGGNWGAAVAYTVPAAGSAPIVAVDDVKAVDFLATPSPSPFRGLSTIRFGLAQSGEVRLELFDVAGRQVQTLVSGVLTPGPHVATWDGRDQRGNQVKNGIYFVRSRRHRSCSTRGWSH